jgi:type 1 glutamine amidotransferase
MTEAPVKSLDQLTADVGPDGKHRLEAVVVGARDSAGAAINPDFYAHAFTYGADNNLATDSFSDGVNTWVQTFTYTSGQLTAVSAWVKA